MYTLISMIWYSSIISTPVTMTKNQYPPNSGIYLHIFHFPPFLWKIFLIYMYFKEGFDIYNFIYRASNCTFYFISLMSFFLWMPPPLTPNRWLDHVSTIQSTCILHWINLIRSCNQTCLSEPMSWSCSFLHAPWGSL